MPRARAAGADGQLPRRTGTSSSSPIPSCGPASPTCGGRAPRSTSPAIGRSGATIPGMMGRVLGGVFHLRDHLHEVPVHVIPCIEGRTDGKGVFAQASRWGSIMPAAWSFMLAARSRGLGSVWTSFHLVPRAGGGGAARDPLRRGDAGGADPGRLHGRNGVQAGGAGAARHVGALGPLVATPDGVTRQLRARRAGGSGRRVEALPLLVAAARGSRSA